MTEPASTRPSLARVKWANERIRDLDTARRAFIDTDPYDRVIEYNDEAKTYTFTITKVHGTPDPIKFLAGEVAHHLRASLDLLVYQLMRHANVAIDDKRLESCAFPILSDIDISTSKGRKKYESTMARKIEGVRPRARALIEGLQPCHARDQVSPLTVVEQMDNIDKHRFLLAVVSGVDVGNMNWKDGSRPPVRIAPHTYIPLNDGTILKVGPTEVKVNPKLPMPLDITFGELGFLWHKPVIPTLQQLSDFIRRTIQTFDSDFLL